MAIISGLAVAVGATAGLACPASAQAVDGESDLQVRVCPDGGYESGCDREDITNAVVIKQAFSADLGRECLFQTRAQCVPVAYGAMPARRHGAAIVWQKMAIQPRDGPGVEMLVISENPGDDPPIILAAQQTEGWYDAPELIEYSDTVSIIHVAGRTGGTGAGNADILLARHTQGLTTFDVNDLIDQASNMLPVGFSLAGGVNFNFREMHAYVPVRRQGDAGCCATGGMAHIDFGLPQANWMQVDSVTFEETTPVRTHRSLAPDRSAETMRE